MITWSQMFPIRCYSCNRCIGDKYVEFERRRTAAMSVQRVQRIEYTTVGSILDDMGVRCMHCRIIFMTHTDHASVLDIQKKQRLQAAASDPLHAGGSGSGSKSASSTGTSTGSGSGSSTGSGSGSGSASVFGFVMDDTEARV